MVNIILIGMPGAGKSTIGVLLAKTMGMPFLDTDLLIQQKTGKLLQEIINQNGIKTFQWIEENVILGIDSDNTIIATGGSAIYSYEAMAHLKKNGIIVYLKVPYEEIEKRINNITTRGIAMTEEQTLFELFEERAPLYEKYSDIVLECADMNMEDIVNLIKSSGVGRKDLREVALDG